MHRPAESATAASLAVLVAALLVAVALATAGGASAEVAAADRADPGGASTAEVAGDAAPAGCPALAGDAAPAGGPAFAGDSVTESGAPPLADAGLDQTVTEGTTVHLDGGGSQAPDGAIERYEWVVTDSDGTEIHRSSGSDPTASFEASSVGGYEARLVVTDDADRSDSDTLFVEVEPDGDRHGEETVGIDALDSDTTVTDVRHRRLVDVDANHLVIERRTVSTTVGSAADRDRALRRGYTVAEVRTAPVFVIERRSGPGPAADEWTAIHETAEIRRAVLAKQRDDLRVDYDTEAVERTWTLERRIETDRRYVDEVGESHDHVRTEVAARAELVGTVEGTGERVDLGVHGFEFVSEEHRSESALRAGVREAVDRADCDVVDSSVTCAVTAETGSGP